MGKKSFRPIPCSTPDYPSLPEVDRGSLARWGLVAVGGLLLGTAACKPAQPNRPPGAAELRRPAPVAVADAGTADASAPNPTPVPDAATAPSPASATFENSFDPLPPNPRRPGLRGHMAVPRVKSVPSK
jgi:hypothetical protein